MSGLNSLEAVVQSDRSADLFIPELAGVSVLFWTCPEHPGGKVVWARIAKDPGGIQDIATCDVCGRKSC